MNDPVGLKDEGFNTLARVTVIVDVFLTLVLMHRLLNST